MVREEILKNGIRFLTVPREETEAATLLVMAGVGSRYESGRLAGASHFIEHMLFKGTKKRPTARRISRDLDAVGAEYNAYTGKEYTGYYIRLHADHLPLAADMLYDMTTAATFKEDELERERGVILEEIKMYEDTPIVHVTEMLDEVFYHGCPLARNIAGTRKTVAEMSRKRLMDFWKSHYIPSNMVVALAGRVDDAAAKEVAKRFARIRTAPKRPRKFRCATMHGGGPKLALTFKETEQVQFALGFPSVPYGHRARPAHLLLAAALGGGMSSRLFEEVREKRGLAYSVSAHATSYHDAGDLMIHAGLSKDRVLEGMRVIMRELRKIARGGIKNEELRRAREFVKGGVILGLETSMNLAEFHARQQLLLGKARTPDEVIASIDRVEKDAVRAAAKQAFRNTKLSAAVIGPFTEKAPFEKVLRTPLS